MAATLAALCSSVVAAAVTGLAGAPAPDFALRSTAGENLRLSEYRGEVVLLSFWASWCGRCQQQLGELADLERRYAQQGVRILTVNIEGAAQPAADAARRHGLTVLHDASQDVARLYEPGTLPLALLLDADGRVRHVHENYRAGDEAAYSEELDALLREQGITP
jgi:peroxiredoxin